MKVKIERCENGEMKNNIDNKLWKEFVKWGSGFTLEADRIYDEEGKPFIYHLTMYGLHFNGDELVGSDLNELFRKAIKIGKKNMKKLLN
jgi:hypothetical protein